LTQSVSQSNQSDNVTDIAFFGNVALGQVDQHLAKVRFRQLGQPGLRPV
jgi:hypothetical protein